MADTEVVQEELEQDGPVGQEPDASGDIEETSDTDTEVGGKEAGATDGPPDVPPTEEVPEDRPGWIKEDHRALAESYGWTEADLVDFGSETDFRAACRLIDRKLAARREAGKETPAETPKAEVPAANEDDDIDLAAWGEYDEHVQKLARAAKKGREDSKALRQEIERTVEQVTQFRKEYEEERARQRFDSFNETIDKMYPDLFGGNGELSKEAIDRRMRVLNAVATVEEIMAEENHQPGRSPKMPPLATLVERAAMMEFGAEILAADRKARNQAILEQSRKRRPAPGKGKVLSTAAPSKNEPKSIKDIVQGILEKPEFNERWNGYMEENGLAPQ